MRSKPRYRQLLDSLTADIVRGRYKPGQKLPSEAALVKKFATSRITAGRAVRELQLRGLVDRVAGSGTFVRAITRQQHGSLLFGLLIPDLGETEIFEPICQGIANAPEGAGHALIWGHTDTTLPSKEEQAWQLCQQYIARGVSGVFFAPLEFELESDRANRRILAALKKAGIAVVLLDRRPGSMPERSRPDLVGLNNRQAGYIATEHLIQLGCKRIGFLAYHGAVPTVTDRIAGYREALFAHGLRANVNAVLYSEASVKSSVEALVCVNDHVARTLIQGFSARKVGVPEEVRIVGIDDLPWAGLLPVPLTTVRQPVREIGETALRTMIERIDRPSMPPRDILLDGELIVRKSCGASVLSHATKARP